MKSSIDSTSVPIPRTPGLRRREFLEAGAVGAVGLLAALLQDERAPPPRLVCQCDANGLIHAPFAAGRAFLAEHTGPAGVDVLVHTTHGGAVRLARPTAAELLPGLRPGPGPVPLRKNKDREFNSAPI